MTFCAGAKWVSGTNRRRFTRIFGLQFGVAPSALATARDLWRACLFAHQWHTSDRYTKPTGQSGGRSVVPNHCGSHGQGCSVNKSQQSALATAAAQVNFPDRLDVADAPPKHAPTLCGRIGACQRDLDASAAPPPLVDQSKYRTHWNAAFDCFVGGSAIIKWENFLPNFCSLAA